NHVENADEKMQHHEIFALIIHKFFNHTAAILEIASLEKIKLKAVDNKTVEYSLSHSDAVNILFRAQYESYLLFYFLFASTRSAEERNFKILVWKFGHVFQEFKRTADKGFSKTVLAKKEAKLNNMKIEIQQSPFFVILTKNQQNCVLKGDSKILIKW